VSGESGANAMHRMALAVTAARRDQETLAAATARLIASHGGLLNDQIAEHVVMRLFEQITGHRHARWRPKPHPAVLRAQQIEGARKGGAPAALEAVQRREEVVDEFNRLVQGLSIAFWPDSAPAMCRRIQRATGHSVRIVREALDALDDGPRQNFKDYYRQLLSEVRRRAMLDARAQTVSSPAPPKRRVAKP
jgi:hypothetical protein